jgi:hypothetical protein
LSLFALQSWASEPSPVTSTGIQANGNAEVVIVHFGDSTCITSYLPNEQRVESVLNKRLAAFYENQRIVSHNVAAGFSMARKTMR